MARCACNGFSRIARGFSAPQIWQFCVFTCPSSWKCTSSLKMIFFEKLPSTFWFSNTKLTNSRRCTWSVCQNDNGAHFKSCALVGTLCITDPAVSHTVWLFKQLHIQTNWQHYPKYKTHYNIFLNNILIFMPYDVFQKYTKHFQWVIVCVHSVFYVFLLFLLLGIWSNEERW